MLNSTQLSMTFILLISVEMPISREGSRNLGKGAHIYKGVSVCVGGVALLVLSHFFSSEPPEPPLDSPLNKCWR